MQCTQAQWNSGSTWGAWRLQVPAQEAQLRAGGAGKVSCASSRLGTAQPQMHPSERLQHIIMWMDIDATLAVLPQGQKHSPEARQMHDAQEASPCEWAGAGASPEGGCRPEFQSR